MLYKLFAFSGFLLKGVMFRDFMERALVYNWLLPPEITETFLGASPLGFSEWLNEGFVVSSDIDPDWMDSYCSNCCRLFSIALRLF